MTVFSSSNERDNLFTSVRSCHTNPCWRGERFVWTFIQMNALTAIRTNLTNLYHLQRRLRRKSTLRCPSNRVHLVKRYKKSLAVLENFLEYYFGSMLRYFILIFCRLEVWKQEHLTPTPATLQNPMAPKRLNQWWRIRKERYFTPPLVQRVHLSKASSASMSISKRGSRTTHIKTLISHSKQCLMLCITIISNISCLSNSTGKDTSISQ